MANTYTLISSNVLTSSAASVTFSSIPATFTDLVLRTSVRSNATGTFDILNIQVNSITGNYSFTRLSGSGSAAASNNGTGFSAYYDRFTINGDTATSNTFGSSEFYIPNYSGSANKVASSFGVSETNATTSYMAVNAHLLSDTSAITSLVLTPNNGTNFVSGSSFYLYGIKNS